MTLPGNKAGGGASPLPIETALVCSLTIQFGRRAFHILRRTFLSAFTGFLLPLFLLHLELADVSQCGIEWAGSCGTTRKKGRRKKKVRRAFNHVRVHIFDS